MHSTRSEFGRSYSFTRPIRNADVLVIIRYFYQYKADRLPTCVLTSHAWLHVPDFMEKSGPLWAFWCWVMERMCARLVRSVSSKKHPNASLDRRTLEYANLNAIVNAFDLQQDLPTFTRIYATSRVTSFSVDYEPYSGLTLRTPTRTVSLPPPTLLQSQDTAIKGLIQLRRRIAVHFSAQWTRPAHDIIMSQVLPTKVNMYSRIELDGGDTI